MTTRQTPRVAGSTTAQRIHERWREQTDCLYGHAKNVSNAPQKGSCRSPEAIAPSTNQGRLFFSSALTDTQDIGTIPTQFKSHSRVALRQLAEVENSLNNSFEGSSAVEQGTVNPLVVGSIPTPRANKETTVRWLFCLIIHLSIWGRSIMYCEIGFADIFHTRDTRR